MIIPDGILNILNKLEENGYEAYIVGGAVRDHIMGRPVHDYDITTSALPDDTERLFSDSIVASIGKKFGTVTVLCDGNFTAEVTTFRCENGYCDGRHPDTVTYAKTVQEDLSRRDFTMNAIAYSPKRGYVDPFGGMNDISEKTVRCVGNAEERFEEDRLRVLRAVRFSSQLDFSLAKDTDTAVRKYADKIYSVSAERIFSELCKLLCGDGVKRVLMEYREVMTCVVPCLQRIDGYDQNNYNHCFELYEHTANCVSYVDAELHLRLAALLHDTGKPACRTTDKDGVSHFKGHPEASRAIAYATLKALKAPAKLCEEICTIIRYHDERIKPERVRIKKLLSKLGEKTFFDLLKLQKADILSQNPKFYSRLENQNRVYDMAREIIKEGTALTVKDLKISGDDIVALGVNPGKEVGEILSGALDMVVNEILRNDREMLLEYVETVINKEKEE